MKIKKSQLKELIKQTIREDWWSMLEPDEQDAYIKAHPKSQKAKDAKKKKSSDEPQAATPATDKDDKRPAKNPFSKESPAHEPWNKEREKDKLDKHNELQSSAEDWNEKAEDGNPVMIDTESHGTVAWEQGDPDEKSFFATDEDGEEIEIDYDDVVRVHDTDDKEKPKTKQVWDRQRGTWKEVPYFDDEEEIANYRKSRGKDESVHESKGKRCTVKEIKKWFKTLEENRYKKTYASDARRVAWFVNNNLSEDYESMPTSMRKKWSKAAYGRERYLAKEFLKSTISNLKEQIAQKKLRKLIKEVIKKELQLNEGYPLEIHVKDKVKVDKILKSMRLKPSKDWTTKFGGRNIFILDIKNNKLVDKVVELLVKNKIKVN